MIIAHNNRVCEILHSGEVVMKSLGCIPCALALDDILIELGEFVDE